MNSEWLRQRIDFEYTPEQRLAISTALSERMSGDDQVYVVIDDDPTGCQTVHDVQLYTEWTPAAMDEALRCPGRLFFVMTNSRSMSPRETTEVHLELTRNVLDAASRLGRRVTFISRGDSTLRGHYPLEPDLLREAVGGDAMQLIIPFFREGNRYTVDNVHYLREGSRYIPVGESEFSRDATFGYRASDLTQWVEEKTGGRIARTDVAAISLDMLRSLDFQAIESTLLSPSPCAVVNATCEDDLRAFAVGYLRAAARGRRFVARTAAAWPKVIGGVTASPLLTRNALVDADNPAGGLIVVGSHVQKTTRQLERLLEGMPGLVRIEFNQHLVFDKARLAEEVCRAAAEVDAALSAGSSCVLYTRREQVPLDGRSGDDELRITRRIADAVCETVQRLRARPRFLLAKGGITSSDIATRALGIRRATVMGQIEPGVPVWLPEGNASGRAMPFIIFPGNVGSEDTLLHAVEKLI